MKWLLLTLVLPHISWATMAMPKIDCPVQFEGRVSEVIGPMGATHGLATNSVVFTHLSAVKGEVKDKVIVDILKDGPFEIEKGEDYRVQLREGRVCWVEKI